MTGGKSGDDDLICVADGVVTFLGGRRTYAWNSDIVPGCYAENGTQHQWNHSGLIIHNGTRKPPMGTKLATSTPTFLYPLVQ